MVNQVRKIINDNTMKLNNIVYISSAVLTLSACAELQETHTVIPQANEPVGQICFLADELETKTVLDHDYHMTWRDDDKTGIFINSATPTENSEGVLSRVGQKTIFTASVTGKYGADDLLYAYYPYNAAQSAGPSAIMMSIPAEQDQGSAIGKDINGACNPMVSIPVKAGKAGEQGTRTTPLTLKFRQLAAMLEFSVYSSEPTFRQEKIQSLTLIESSGKTIAGSFSYDLTKITAEGELPSIDAMASGSSIIQVNLTDVGSGNLEKAQIGHNTFYVSILPGSYKLSVKVTTDKGSYVFPLKHDAVSYNRAHLHRYTLDLAKAGRASSKGGLYQLLTEHEWFISKFGWGDAGNTWEYSDDPVYEHAKDDRMTFASDGKMHLSLGATDELYTDDGLIHDAPETGTEGWVLIENEGLPAILRLFGGAHLAMAGDMYALDGGDYRLSIVKNNTIRLAYCQKDKLNEDGTPAEQEFLLYLTCSMNDREFAEVLQANTWKIVEHGWYGTGFECFEPTVPENHADDIMEFLPDGKFVLDQGQDKTILYDDKNNDTAPLNPQPTVTGKERWEVLPSGSNVVLRLSEGGFPGIIPDRFAIIGGDYILHQAGSNLIQLSYWQQEKDQYMAIRLEGTAK